MNYVFRKTFVLMLTAGLFCYFTAVLPAMESRITGRVVKVMDGMVFIDAGFGKQVEPGDRFEVLQRGGNGAISKISVLSVTQVFEKTSIGVPLAVLPGRSVTVNDMIIEARGIMEQAQPVSPAYQHPVVRTKKIHASENNTDVIVSAEIVSGAALLRTYCIYRFKNDGPWSGMALLPAEDSATMVSGVIPGGEIQAGRIEYYIVAVDVNDRIGYSGNQEYPHRALVSVAEPYYTGEAESDQVLNNGANTEDKWFPWLLVPGLSQIRSGNRLKGLTLLGLETAAVATGIAVGSDQAIYYSVAGLVYAFNLADGLLVR